jgi:hypothetical protein
MTNLTNDYRINNFIDASLKLGAFALKAAATVVVTVAILCFDEGKTLRQMAWSVTATFVAVAALIYLAL